MRLLVLTLERWNSRPCRGNALHRAALENDLEAAEATEGSGGGGKFRVTKGFGVTSVTVCRGRVAGLLQKMAEAGQGPIMNHNSRLKRCVFVFFLGGFHVSLHQVRELGKQFSLGLVLGFERRLCMLPTRSSSTVWVGRRIRIEGSRAAFGLFLRVAGLEFKAAPAQSKTLAKAVPSDAVNVPHPRPCYRQTVRTSAFLKPKMLNPNPGIPSRNHCIHTPKTPCGRMASNIVARDLVSVVAARVVQSCAKWRLFLMEGKSWC